MSFVFPQLASGPEREGLLVEIDGRKFVANTEAISWRTIPPTRPGSDQGTGASASTLTNEVVWSRWRNNWIHGEGQEYADRTQGEEESDEWRYLTATDIDTTVDNRIALADRPLSLTEAHGWNEAFRLESTGAGSILQTPTTDGVWIYTTFVHSRSIVEDLVVLESSTDQTRIRFRRSTSSAFLNVEFRDDDGTTHSFTSDAGMTDADGWARAGFVYFDDGGTPTVRFFQAVPDGTREDWGAFTQLGTDQTGTAWTPGATDTLEIGSSGGRTAHAEMAFGFDDITSAADFDKRTNPTRFFETNWSTSDGWLGETGTTKNLVDGASGQITDLEIATADTSPPTAEDAHQHPRELRPWFRGYIGSIFDPGTPRSQQVVAGIPMDIRLDVSADGLHRDSMFVWAPGDETIRLAVLDDTPLVYDELRSFILGGILRDLTVNAVGDVFTIEGTDRRTIGMLDISPRTANDTPPSTDYDPDFYTAANPDSLSFIAAVGTRVLFGEEGQLQELNTDGSATLVVDRGTDFIWSGALAVGTGVVVWGTFGDRTEIFTMTTSELDGTFQPPEPAANMAFGEEVTSMIDVAGVLVLGTTTGLRLAVINADSSITYGPVNDTIGGVYEVVAAGLDVYAVTTESPTLWRFDLTEFVEELVPAFYGVSVTPRDDVYVPDADGWSGEPYWSATPVLHDNREADDVDDNYETRLVAIAKGRLVAYVPHEAEDQVGGGVRAIDGEIDLGLFTFDVGEPIILDTVRIDWRVEGTGNPNNQDDTTVRVVVEDDAGNTLIDQTDDNNFAERVVTEADYAGVVDAKGLRLKLFPHGDIDSDLWPVVTSITLRGVPVPFMSEEIELPIILRETVESEHGQDVDFDVFPEWGFLREICRQRKRFRLKVGSYESWARLESIEVERGALGGGNGLDGYTRQDEFLKGEWICRFTTQTPDLIGGFTGGFGGEENWENASTLAYFDANHEEYGRNEATGAGTWFDRTEHHRHATTASDAPVLDVAHDPDAVVGSPGILTVPDAVPATDYTVSFVADQPSAPVAVGQTTAWAGRREGSSNVLQWGLGSVDGATWHPFVRHDATGITFTDFTIVSGTPSAVTIRYDSSVGDVFCIVDDDVESAGDAIEAFDVVSDDLILFGNGVTDSTVLVSTFGLWSDGSQFWAVGVHDNIKAKLP